MIETNETIDILTDEEHIKSFDLKKILNHISVFDFYSLPISSKTGHQNDYLLLSDYGFGTVYYAKQKGYGIYGNPIKLNYQNNCTRYHLYQRETEGSESLNKENWFKIQTELVEIKEGEGTHGFKIPKFIKDIIPEGMKIYDWKSVSSNLKEIKERCYFVNKRYLDEEHFEFFEFDPEKYYKKYDKAYYWSNPRVYKHDDPPKITFAGYVIDKKTQSLNLKELYVNGKRTAESAAFKIKAKYDLDNSKKSIRSQFGTRFKEKVYDKLSDVAKANFEPALKTNEAKKLTYVLTEPNIWDLTFGPLKQGIHYTSSDKRIEMFVELVNSYYSLLEEDKKVSEQALTPSPVVDTLSDKQLPQSPISNSSQEKNKMAINAKDKVIQIAISDGQEVAKRVATKQISKLMQDTLVKALTQDMKGKKKSDTKTALEEFFASEKGMAVIQVICGVGLPFAEKYIPAQYHSKLKMIADEMRVQGETTAALELIGAVEPLVKMAAGGIMDSLNQFSSIEEFVRVETETVSVSKTDQHKEAEVVELASAKERAKA